MFKKLFRSKLFIGLVGFVGIQTLAWGLVFLPWEKWFGKSPKKRASSPPKALAKTPFWGPSTGYPAIPGAGTSWAPGTNPPDSTQQQQLISLINLRRGALRLPALIWHDGLTTAAELHSSDMYQRNYFSTVTPEGFDLPYRVTSATPPISFSDGYGILAQTNSSYDTTSLYNSLMADPAASSALLYPGMTQVGIGYAGSYPARWTIILGQNVVP